MIDMSEKDVDGPGQQGGRLTRGKAQVLFKARQPITGQAH